MKISKQKARRVLNELQRRHTRKPKWEEACFKEQWGFITDPSRFKALQCTRRAGKSYSGGLYAFKEASETPNCSVVIVGLTRDSVKRIFFKDILKQIDRQFILGTKFNGSDLTATLPNGSVIYLLGVDANPDDMDKLLGQKNKLVIVDEAAFYKQNMNKLVYEVLQPSLIDYDGTIALISTTSSLTKSLYYDITNGIKAGWSLHKWSATVNPHVAKTWDRTIKHMIKTDPLVVETPTFKRMYLNQWFIDTDSLVYKYNVDKNTANSLPDNELHYTLGIDLGWNDATAFVLCAYTLHDPHLYVIDTFKSSEMLIEEIADKIKELDTKYDIETMVIDGASKQVVEELKQRYHLPLIIAEKQGKREFIEILNNDLITGKILMLPKASGLIEEMDSLIWNEKAMEKGKYEEHAACENHLCDAFLYAFRHCFNYASTPREVIPLPSSEAAVDAFWERQGELEEERHWEEDSKESDLFG